MLILTETDRLIIVCSGIGAISGLLSVIVSDSFIFFRSDRQIELNRLARKLIYSSISTAILFGVGYISLLLLLSQQHPIENCLNWLFGLA